MPAQPTKAQNETDALKAELKGYFFNGQSDREALERVNRKLTDKVGSVVQVTLKSWAYPHRT
ncbi:Uncharacterised protein [uncultured archaeon]|nr:Uncharacterised protein [uncultured archaeon]